MHRYGKRRNKMTAITKIRSRLIFITILMGTGLLFFTFPLYAAQYTMRLALPDAPGTKIVETFRKWDQMIQEDLGEGVVEIKYHLGGSLGTLTQTVEGLQLGTHDLTNTFDRLQKMVPELEVFSVPFLFKNRIDFERMLHGTTIVEEMQAKLAAKGIIDLAWWDKGFRCMTNNKRPIRVPSDCEGLKMRTPPNPMTIKMFKQFGANPAPLSFVELFSALKQGTFDGQENPLSVIKAAKFYEVQKYLSLTVHRYGPGPVLISKKLWDTFPPHVQASLKNNAIKVGYWDRARSQKAFEEDLEFLKDKIEINEADIDAFREASKPIYDTYKYQDLLKRILAVTK
jgi:tripartite ATP-independent transporter DctP family solute receptor